MNKIANRLILMLAVLFGSINNIFAANIQDAFGELKPIFTNTAVLDGMAIIFIYMGFYMLYFTLLQFFVKKMEANKRIRVSLAIILSFFSGSTLIYAFSGSGEKLFLSIGSWLLLLILIPGLLAFAYQYTRWIWKREEMNKTLKFFWLFLGLLSIDFLFTQMLTWLSDKASVGGLSGEIMETILEWNMEIYGFLSFAFAVALIALFIFLFSKGFGGSVGNDKTPEQKNRSNMKQYLKKIQEETNKTEKRMRLLTDNLKEIIRKSKQESNNPQFNDSGYLNEVYSGGSK